jgi:phage-related protein
MARMPVPGERPLARIGSSKRDFLEFPERVIDEMGNALGIAQFGGKHDGNTYRAVYTVRFGEIVYVLHAFQKKSPRGVKTARGDVELVTQRLKTARRDYEEHYGKAR